MRFDTILAALEHHAAHQPQAIFSHFLTEGRALAISYRDLHDHAASFSAFLSSHDVGLNDTILIILPHDPAMVYGFLGAMQLGAVPSLMPFPSPKQDHSIFWASHRKLLKLTNIRFILTYEAIAAGMAEHFGDLDITVLLVETIGDAASHKRPTARQPQPNEIAFLQHSSGTTGLKKGILLTHAAVVEHIYSYAMAADFTGSDIIVSWLPLYHDMGLISCFLMTIIMGSTLVWMDPFRWVRQPTLLLTAIEDYQGTFVIIPNFAFLHMARSARPEQSWDLSSLRMVVNCSEPCKPESFTRFLQAFERCGVNSAMLRVCYGMAENVFSASQTPLNKPVREVRFDIDAIERHGRAVPAPAGAPFRVIMSCGVPIPGTTIRIVDKDRKEVASGHFGEIAVQSPYMFSGYNKIPELTAEKLVDGWLYSGDQGFLYEGELFVLGRKDDLMIIYGRNYYAHNIEQAVNSGPGAAPGRVVAFPIDNADMGTQEAVVLIESDGTFQDAELRRVAKKRIFDLLSLSVQRVDVVKAGALIKSTAGKISRDQNRNRFMAGELTHG